MRWVLLALLPFQLLLADQGIYLSSFLGGNYPDYGKVKVKNVDFPVEESYRLGATCAVALGYQTLGGWSLEVEGTARANHVRFDLHFPRWVLPITGEALLFSALCNVRRHFTTGLNFDPYVGAGLGMGHLVYSLDHFYGHRPKIPSETRFVYQVMAGVRRFLKGSIWIGVEYRFFGAELEWSVHEVGLTVGKLF
jgi:opacity protein-like surface antigen